MATAAKKATARGANPTEAVSHLADVTDRMHGLLMAAWKVRPKKRNWRCSRISSRPTNVSAGRREGFARAEQMPIPASAVPAGSG
jgi:hypothetical protein